MDHYRNTRSDRCKDRQNLSCKVKDHRSHNSPDHVKKWGSNDYAYFDFQINSVRSYPNNLSKLNKNQTTSNENGGAYLKYSL